MSIKFKGISVEPGLARVLPHVSAAEEYGGTLQHLQSVWDNLSLLGQLSGANADMTNTRRAFGELAVDLLNQLGKEALNKSLQEMGAKAQVAINILVRNLFERTADIGFLACDEDIRAYLRQHRAGAEGCDAAAAALRRRFGEYVRKYSVYSDIILLDPQGRVLVRLNEEDSVETSADPIIRTALTTGAAFVERFAVTDLVADERRQLIYAYRVADDGGKALGVLCLRFRFENELDLIFSNLVSADDWAVITMLDDNGVVIASSDPVHIPLGVKFTPVLDADHRIVKFGASEYIATTRSAQPYQGYSGLGWYGHAMVPIQHAFGHGPSEASLDVEPQVLDRIIEASSLYSKELREIPSKAEHIQRQLNRSVWNGNASQRTSGQAGTSVFSKILLKEISETGLRTKDVFEGSIGDLHQTVVTSLLHDNRFHASLAIDIMDRNLYERANDCRWWALAAVFAELLSKPERSAEDGETIAAILRTINGLYTVYTNLIVFDADGVIVAASNPTDTMIGSKLEDEWVGRVLALHDAQGYAVSSFVPTPIYGGRPTYIYGAAIRGAHPRPAGGVAVVFDSEPQFAAMLRDALPRDNAGEIKLKGAGLFVEPDGRVIASSDDRFKPGDRIALHESFLTLSPGKDHSGIVEFDGAYYAVGARASAGYREYKGPSDAYHSNVIALMLTRLCEVNAQSAAEAAERVLVRSDRMSGNAREDIATFRVGRQWFAVRAGEIIEAIDANGIVPLPHMPNGVVGCVIYRDAPLPVLDLQELLADKGQKAARTSSQIVVMVPEKEDKFGVIVDDLGEIAEVLTSRLAPLPPMVAENCAFADTAFAPDAAVDGELIVMLRADRLCTHLVRPGAASEAA